MADSLKVKDKVENPKTHFVKPKDIVQDKALTHDEKKKAHNTWEQDERRLLTASNEGMSGSEEGRQSDDDSRLGEVVSTKEKNRRKAKPQIISLSAPSKTSYCRCCFTESPHQRLGRKLRIIDKIFRMSALC